jgi:hypothetical protein
MKAEDIKEGMKVRGFKFKGASSPCGYTTEMDEYVGELGTITSVGSTTFQLVFKDGKVWNYPIADFLDLQQDVEDMQEYVGQEIIGFEFKDTSYIDYGYEHENYIGVLGTIVEVEHDGGDDYSCRVEFPNNEEGEWYPMTNIDNHIVNPTPVDLNELFNQIKQI